MPVCTFCGSLAHTQFRCPLKPRTVLRTTKPMNKVGRVTRATNRAVAQWKRTQKPNHQGYYECYLCHKWITYLEAEHVKGKARHPADRTNLQNLKPVCSECNANKGSKDLGEL